MVSLRPAGAASPMRIILRNCAFNLGAQGLYAVFQLVGVFLLARALGREGLGDYFTLFALILVVQVLLEQSLATVLTCRIAQAPAAWRATVAEAAGLFVLVTLASGATACGLGACWSLARGATPCWASLAAAGAACAAIQVQRFCGGVFHAFEVFSYENWGRILQGGLFAGLLGVLFVSERLTVASALAALAASHVAAAVFLLVCLQWNWGCVAVRLSVRQAWSWLAQASPLSMGDMGRGVAAQLGTHVLGLFQPAAAVGIYSIAYRPLGPINLLPRLLLQTVFPSLARLADADRSALARAFATSVRLLWFVSLPIAVTICICAAPLIELLAGPDFLEATLPMQVVIWGTCLSFVSYPFRYLFTALRRSAAYSGLVLGALTFQAVALVALAQTLGALGACIAGLLGELVFALAGLALCRHCGVGGVEGRALTRAVLAAAVMAAALGAARSLALPLLLPAIVCAAGLYLLLCVYLGVLRKDEVRHVREMLTGLLTTLRRNRGVHRPCSGRLTTSSQLGQT